MRKASGITLIGVAAALFILWLLPPEQQEPWNLDAEEATYYRMKRQGKRPKLMRQPNTWFYEQRAYPYEKIPQDQYLKALDEARVARVRFKSSAAQSVAWFPAGPTNIPGRISAIDVHSSQPNTIYAGSAAGGVYKTTDLGGSWTAVFDDVGTFSVGAVAIDPGDPNTIYVGTGEASASLDSYEGTGVYKSTDGGISWTNVGLPNSARIGKIVVDPVYPETLYVAVQGPEHGNISSPDRGLYRSENGGSTWDRILYVDNQTGCIDVALHPSTGTVFAATYRGSINGIWRSADHGDSWAMISGTGGLPSTSGNGRIGLTVDPLSNTVYTIHISSNTNDLRGLYKSTDLGLNWTRTNDAALQGSFGGFGWYFGQVRVAPGNPDIVYSLGVSLWKSSDGGASWANFTNGTHVDHHAMYILESDPEVVYDGCDGGVNYTSNGGISWTIFRNMGNTQFYAMTVDYNNPERIYGGTQDNGTMRTLTGGTGDWDEIFGGDGFYSLVDYTNPNIIYVESQFGNLYKSTDGGFNFSWAQSGINPSGMEEHGWNTPLAMDPNHPNILYYGTSILYKSEDGAENWVSISPSFTYRYITTIGVARSDSQVVYIGTRTGDVHVTTDGGGTWSDIAAGLPDRWMTRLTVDSYDAAVCYVTVSGYITDGSSLPHIYRTTNYGAFWTDISSNLPDAPLNDVVIDPHDNQTLYVGSDVGVFVSNDIGGSWAPLGTGMPVTCVHDLEFNPRERLLVAATHGRSMFKTTLPCPDAFDDDGDGIGNDCDNCPETFNPDQTDADGDLLGDACDDCVDPDGDGRGNPGYPSAVCPDDNCPYVYNPDQTDTDGDGIGDVCEFATVPSFDTIATSCVRLMVSNSGNFANMGTHNVTLDYGNQGDCATVYVFDGTPVLTRYTGSTYLADFNLFNRNSFKQPLDGNPTEPVVDAGAYEIFKTGTFVTDDEGIALEKEWYAPKQADSCQFVIQCLRVYSWDGATHTGLALGEAMDLDIPSGSGANNTGGVDLPAKLIYQRGVGIGCQNNENRYGGISLLGAATITDDCVDTSLQPFGAYTALNSVYLWPTGTFVSEQLYNNMQQPGFNADLTEADQHTVMTFFNSLTVAPAETLSVYSIITTVRDGSATDLADNVYKARQWFADHIRPVCSGSFANGDIEIHLNGGDDVAYTGQVNTVEFWISNGAALDSMSIAFEYSLGRDYAIKSDYGSHGYINEEGDAVGVFDLTGLVVTPSIDGVSPDSILLSGARVSSGGLPVHTTHTLCYTMQVEIPFGQEALPGGFCLDNIYYPPAGDWFFADSGGDYPPLFQGTASFSRRTPSAPAVCFDIVEGSCCFGLTGNVNCDSAEQVDIGDVTELVRLLFIDVGEEFCCEEEADLDFNEIVDIGDVTILVSVLFIDVTDPPACR